MQTTTTLTPVQVVRLAAAATQETRWRVADVAALFELPFNDLIFRAQQVHREHFDPNEVQLSTLLSTLSTEVHRLPTDSAPSKSSPRSVPFSSESNRGLARNE